MHRRHVLQAVAGVASGGLGVGRTGFVGAAPARGLAGRIELLPNFCSHEHWGSIEPIGGFQHGTLRADMEPGATPLRPVTICDLVFEPYFNGWIEDAGFDTRKAASEIGAADLGAAWATDPARTLALIRPHLERNILNGGFQATRAGIKRLHGMDVARLDLKTWLAADRAVGAAYADVFASYQSAMKAVHFTELLRPVHPEFFDERFTGPTVQQERAFMRPVLRVDPMVSLARDEKRRRRLAAQFGVEPLDAASWRQFLEKIFAAAARNGTVSIKQALAYGRDLNFLPRQDNDPAIPWKGAKDRADLVALEDWIVHQCCMLAHERGWPHQVHTGTTNLPASNPLPLRALAQRYPKMPLVLIHAWPYLDEAAWLAKNTKTIYLDTNWQAILNPSFYREALHKWLAYVPTTKIMTGHDATTVEMAVGSAQIVRSSLAEALAEQGRRLGLPEALLVDRAADILQNNAVRVYGVGKTFTWP